MKLPTMYIATTQKGTESLSYAAACIVFEICIRESLPCRVFKIEFDVETNAFETASEITGDLAARIV